MINQYEIIDELGRGVHGKVKLGRNLTDGSYVAIKIVEKLLNYSIITPAAVIEWALVSDRAGPLGEALGKSLVFELVFNTRLCNGSVPSSPS